MGDDPKKAPLNKWGQANDCKNLFVTDGSVFTQQSEKNPTWTMLACPCAPRNISSTNVKNKIFRS